ncbi:hypothetical protein K474DRAFT_1667757 [Panus rudis PR-1116 ss-1]|nr:hypothetical protein K474DRAFT_1667757 [Panus rudis PR-1116 ss-1]
MAPLIQAINAEYLHDIPEGGVSVYKGTVDPEWTIVAVPHGGYVLGLIIEAAIKKQLSTSHRDPIHVTAHFLRSASVAPFEVHIRILKAGRGFTNLTADFVQDGQIRIMTHIVFGTLADPADSDPSSAASRSSLTLQPPSPYARRIPFYTLPSQCPSVRAKRRWRFDRCLNLVNDPVYIERAKVPREGMEWGLYLSLTDERERITTPSLAFMADMFVAVDEVIKDGPQAATRHRSWAPTMVMTIEFKFPIPPPSNPDHDPRTVAIYSSGRFMNDPQARHDTYVEVWTAPPSSGNGPLKENWREGQRCLAVSTQMALLVPMEINRKKGQKDVQAAKL